MRAQVEWYQREGSGLGEMKAFVKREGWGRGQRLRRVPIVHTREISFHVFK